METVTRSSSWVWAAYQNIVSNTAFARVSLVSTVGMPSFDSIHLTNGISGNTLTFTWPAGQSWRLVSQTNTLSTGLTTNGWSTVPGGIDGSNNVTIDPAQPTVFYRLVYP